MTQVAADAKGIQQTKEAVSYFIHALKVGSEVLEDKKISLGDAAQLFNLFDGLNDAISGAEEIPAELKDLGLDEADELIQLVVTNYSFSTDKAKEVVEKALKALRSNYEVYLLVRG